MAVLNAAADAAKLTPYLANTPEKGQPCLVKKCLSDKSGADTSLQQTLLYLHSVVSTAADGSESPCTPGTPMQMGQQVFSSYLDPRPSPFDFSTGSQAAKAGYPASCPAPLFSSARAPTTAAY